MRRRKPENYQMSVKWHAKETINVYNITGGQGYYVNIDSSSMTAGQKSKLELFFIPSLEKHCLTFWYYVDGASGATLKIKTKVN